MVYHLRMIQEESKKMNQWFAFLYFQRDTLKLHFSYDSWTLIKILMEVDDLHRVDMQNYKYWNILEVYLQDEDFIVKGRIVCMYKLRNK